MKSILVRSFVVLVVALFFVTTTSVVRAEETLNVYFFYGNGCPHCAKEHQYLKDVLQKKYANLNIYEYEIYYNQGNVTLFQTVAEELEANASGVPFLVIGDKYFIGYSDSISPKEIESRVSECLSSFCPDSVGSIVGVSQEVSEVAQNTALKTSTVGKEEDGASQNITNDKILKTETEAEEENVTPQNTTNNEASKADTVPEEKNITLPILGTVDVYSFSLPILTVVMGLLDGFNPCALWTLLFLISLLLGMENRKRMWILGTTFIIASASVYFIFMATWLNLILFLGFVIWIRTLIGLLAIAGGGYSLKEFFTNKNSGCKVTNGDERKKIFDTLKQITQTNSLWIALIGIILLAFAVNLVELICSAGLPAVYTQVLALNDFSVLQYYLYILLYVFFFMLDDLFIFFMAMVTLEMTGITTKYSRISRFVGGVVMVTIGLLLIFKPEWLLFG